MNLFPRQTVLLAALCAIAISCVLPAHAQLNLRHRYTFDEASGDIAGDFYNGANGSLSNAVFTGSGAVSFNGSNAYVNLPNGIISALNNATFEAWVTWGGGAGNFQRIFDFGNSITGENTSGSGSNYVFLTARTGGNFASFGARSRGMTADNLAVNTLPLPVNTLTHVAVSYDWSNSVAKLYVNGVYASQARATQALASIQDVNNWLGRSQWGGDAYYIGSMSEFRIYDEALSSPRIAANAFAGPDNDAGDPGSLVSIRLVTAPVSYVRGVQQAQVFADFDFATNANVTFGEGATFSSSNPNILTVDTNGIVRGIAIGTADVIATYQGLSATNTLTVLTIHGATLKHRYDFNEPPGSLVVNDLVSGAHGRLNNPSNLSVFTGSALVLSNGTTIASGTTNGSFVDLPNGIIRALTNATFETWVRMVPVANLNWQRIYDFGDSTGGESNAATGISYVFFSPRTGTTGGSRFAVKPPTGGETVNLNAGQLPNAERHVVVTYHAGINESRLYIDGALTATGPGPTPFSVINDINNWLGRSQFSGDHYFNGVFNEFRIYEGTMSEGDVVASFAGGPSVTNATAGNLVSITLRALTTMQGGAQAAAALANYQNVSGVDVTVNSQTSFTSSDTNILTVSATGLIQALAAGTATITATHGGLQDSKTITVTGGASTSVKHQWSFNETSGTTVFDYVGGAHGTVVNPSNTTFTGTSLRLNNGASNVETNAYVDLPNNIIRVLSNATFETWVTWQGNFAGNWQRIFDFGSTDQGENIEGTGRTYLFLTPRSGATGNRIRTAITTNTGGGERLTESLLGAMPQNTQTHLAIVYNSGDNGTNAATSLYVNGVLASSAATATPLAGLNDVNNWLGRAQYNDPYFVGAYEEFRIYSGALLPGEVAASFATGPDVSYIPKLSIVRSGSNATLTWRSSPLGTFNLQAVGALGVGQTWQPVNEQVTTVGGTNTVTVSLSTTNQFFQLKK